MAPKFSVVIPAYNQAEYLADAIESVLSQTYSDFELIIVNDASPDHTDDVVKGYTDSRIKYIIHERNKGLPAARNSGIRASSGKNVALLDSDDYFHPEKLMAHARFLEAHPEIGVTYNPRFNLNHSAKTIRNMYRPKRSVDLSDLVLGFPFSPSDMVIRKEWIDQVGLFDETLVNGAEDMEYPCRLALADCKFAGVDQVLNYRRYNLKKSRRSMYKRKNEYDQVLKRVFLDPRCPEKIRDLADEAYGRRALPLAYFSFVNEDIEFAQELIQEVVKKIPVMIKGYPAPLVDAFLVQALNNSIEGHEDVLKTIFAQFPEELKFLDAQLSWAVNQGYLIKITRSVIWKNFAETQTNIESACRLGVKVDEFFLERLKYDLINIDEVLGEEACQQSFTHLYPVFSDLGTPAQFRVLDGQVSIARVFRNYRDHQYPSAVKNVFDAFRKEPKAILNRGILSIFARSMVNYFKQS